MLQVHFIRSKKDALPEKSIFEILVTDNVLFIQITQYVLRFVFQTLKSHHLYPPRASGRSDTDDRIRLPNLDATFCIRPLVSDTGRIRLRARILGVWASSLPAGFPAPSTQTESQCAKSGMFQQGTLFFFFCTVGQNYTQ